jgi:hypothetical protein
MTDKLQGLLLGYIRENNPELLLQLEQDDALHAWVLEKIREVALVLNNAKPSALNEHECMEILTADLRPSKFRYVQDLFETEFRDDYERMLAAGTLTYELIEMVSACHSLFEDMPLVEGMDNPQLDHAVAGVINDYLQGVYE